LEAAHRQVRWQVEQCDRLTAESQYGEEEVAQISAEITQLEGKIEAARGEVRTINLQLGDLALDEFQSQVTHWNTLLAVAERSLASGKNRLNGQSEMLERGRRAVTHAQARLNELNDSQSAMERDKGVQRQAEAQLNEQMEALQTLIAPAEAELDAAERRQEKLQTEDAAARQSLSIAEHQYAQVRIALAKSQEALESLHRRIEEDFGLVAFDYAEEISGQTPLPLEGMVEELPRITKLSPELDENIQRQRAVMRRLGPVNPEAQSEYQEVKERFHFLTTQVADLEKAETDVRQVIAELDELMQREFRRTFEAVAEEFKTIFARLFGGGSARLVLTDPDDLTDTGIEIEARLPGRRTQGLSLLSGENRSDCVSWSLHCSGLPRPSVLDEVDAMLDEANVGRFRDLLANSAAPLNSWLLP
jgi:chromosome segregation protein